MDASEVAQKPLSIATKRIGPLPAWGWVGVGVGGFVAYGLLTGRKKQATSAAVPVPQRASMSISDQGANDWLPTGAPAQEETPDSGATDIDEQNAGLLASIQAMLDGARATVAPVSTRLFGSFGTPSIAEIESTPDGSRITDVQTGITYTNRETDNETLSALSDVNYGLVPDWVKEGVTVGSQLDQPTE